MSKVYTLSVRETIPHWPDSEEAAVQVLCDLLRERGAPFVPYHGHAHVLRSLLIYPLMKTKIDERVRELVKLGRLERELELAEMWR